jgi:recombination protein RecT
MSSENTEVSTTNTGIKTVQDLVHSEGFMSKVAKQSAKGFDVERMMGAVWTSMQKVPDLQNCTLESVALCLKEASYRGLMPDGILGEAYLIPFRDNKKGITNCTLIVGVQGLLKLIRNSGEVELIIVNEVYEEDTISVTLGLEQKLDHTPNYDSNKRKPTNVKGVYASVKLKNGEKPFVYMTRDEIKAIQSKSRGGSSGPWKDHWVEMAKKTVIRRLCKYLPLSEDVQEDIKKDMEREEPKRVFDAEDEDIQEPVKSIEALTEDLKGEKSTEGVAVCSECGAEGDIGPSGNCSPCQARLDNES